MEFEVLEFIKKLKKTNKNRITELEFDSLIEYNKISFFDSLPIAFVFRLLL
jgi:hypothetical protein